jgi:hypothetical protein
VPILRQDVWVGAGDRRRGLRLGPFHEAPVRLLTHPPAAVSLDEPYLEGFLERLGETVEVLAVEPRPAQGPSRAEIFDAWCRDQRALVDWIGERWSGAAPVVLCGIAEGAAVCLAVADHGAVRGVAAVSPTLPEGGAAAAATPALLEKPVLVVAPRGEPAVDRGRLEGMATAWPRVTWLAPSGDTDAFLNDPLAAAIAAWAIEVTRA